MNDTPEQEDPMDSTQGNDATPGAPAGTLPPGPPSGHTQAPRRPIWRSRTDRWVAGVAGGLAQYFGIDTIIVRILFFGLTFIGGLGLVLYLAAWALIPEEGSDRAAGQDLVDRAKDAPSWLSILLIVLGAIIAITYVSHWVTGPIVWGVVLIGAGIWLYRRPDTPPPPPPSQPPETQPDAGSRGASGAVPPPPPGRYSAAQSTPTAPIPAPWSRQASMEREARRRRRSHLGRLTVAIGLVVIGAIAMLHNAGAVTVAPRNFPAIALLIVGGGLLVGSLWGRSRGLIFLGLLIVPFALTANVVHGSLRGGTGDRFFAPISASETARGYQLGAGQMRIDLTDMDWSQPVRVRATLGLGELDVTVPPDVRVDVRSHVGGGAISLFGMQRSGTDVTFNTVEGSSTFTKTLVLDARVSLGEINVDRGTASNTPATPVEPSDLNFNEPDGGAR